MLLMLTAWGGWGGWACRWMRPLVIAAVVNKGYAVHQTDVDIAYSPFGKLATLLSASAREGRADVAWGVACLMTARHHVLSCWISLVVSSYCNGPTPPSFVMRLQ
jgi:hypothetical protein